MNIFPMIFLQLFTYERRLFRKLNFASDPELDPDPDFLPESRLSLSSGDPKVNCWHIITEVIRRPISGRCTVQFNEVWARKNGRESVPFFNNYLKKGHSHGLKNELTAGFLTKNRQ